MKPKASDNPVKPSSAKNAGMLHRNNPKVFKDIANATNTCFLSRQFGGINASKSKDKVGIKTGGYITTLAVMLKQTRKPTV